MQACPFCGSTGGSSAGKTSLLPADERYTEITLQGDPRNHPHLVFEDDQGRRTGIVDGTMLHEIPDVEVVKTYAVDNSDSAPEPRFRLPQGADYTITVDGSDLTKTAKPKINLVGNGLVVDVEDVKIAPGQKDAMALPGGYGITYQTNAKDGIAPNFYAGLVQGDAAYNFAASAVGVKKGSTISLLVEQKDKVVILDSTGSEGAPRPEPRVHPPARQGRRQGPHRAVAEARLARRRQGGEGRLRVRHARRATASRCPSSCSTPTAT